MRIAINADYLNKTDSEIGRYLAQLITSLGMTDGVNEYLVMSPHPLTSRPLTPSTFTWEEVSTNGPPVRRLQWEQHLFPETARRLNAKALFVPHFALPTMATLPVIATVHDLLPFALPDYRPRSHVWLYYRWIMRAMRRNDVVLLTFSDHIKSELIRLRVPAERIFVIAGASRPLFRPVTDTMRQRAIRAKYGLKERFLVYNGGFDLRKNMPMLIGAFAAAMHRLNNSTTQLLLIGTNDELGTSALYPDWRPLVRKFGLESRVLQADIPVEDLPALYSSALAFVYPSAYEGFGWYPLEAMACGAPVIVSDYPAIQETVGTAGLSFPNMLGHEGADSDPMRMLITLITRIVASDELREEYRLRGLARAKRFSWSQVAADTSGIFAEIVGIRH